MLAFTPLFLALASSAFALPQVAKRSKTYTIKVGADSELKFDPPAIFADIGDEVIFQFTSKNHSVVQSSFASPCGHLDGGFKTDFMPVAAGLTDDQLPTAKFTVTESEPLWFYCSQALHTPAAHCKKGMVFAINCPATGEKSFDNFKASAIASNADQPLADPAPATTDVIDPVLPDPTYAGVTLPPAETAATKTDVITLGTSTWTTTWASYPNSPDPTPNAVDGNEIKVAVGANGELTFTPAHVEAKPRDRIVFEFQSKNHSVVQSSFGAPCTPFTSLQGASGVNSGFMPVVAGQANPSFTITVNDTTPLYFYCAQTGHCGKGMVFSVNTNEQGARNYNAFQSLAKQLNASSTDSAPSPSSTTDGTGSASRSVASAGLLFAGALAAILL
ncbi:hypothetical protein EXIGLDRAFT_711578 [Exidia glandulosa HHB12029]|uniref:Cupredoxin n=1 Tax=Exidia glandulosa HHB12029 TaxID=1314781 RepID=A0A165F321_EXIGL|nr:hypothetical protein EXIGLDRAFT_711578 [Exidia glandulosa HHB12029]